MKISLILLLFIAIFQHHYSPCYKSCNYVSDDTLDARIKTLWENKEIQNAVSFDVFRQAMTGLCKTGSFSKTDKIVIIDYTKPSTEERFYVIDLVNQKLIYRCFVAHGRNTGENEAKFFSNEKHSLKSCTGFFRTADTYYGKHGYSLRLDGLEKDINDNARSRAIVIHGADYVSQDFIDKHGRLGRSWGCPALSVEIAKEVIDTIADGYCLFIFGG